ncbi:tetratricopeptide repeat protein [Streptomyces sp. NPDC001910]|uniref:tetratricopeptide repeat protein n=1 Tax=Streptomyces sp. NPDC001910 TaxID=3154403 RepID=UPI0033179443
MGAAVLALFGRALTRSEAELGERRHEQADAASHLLTLGKGGNLPRVREINEPTLVGIHPNATSRTHPNENWDAPPYIPRDIEADLRHAIHGGGFILLIGDSTAGKTRSGFEAARALLPEHVLLSPRRREGIPSVVTSLNVRRPYLIWLDDLERFLGPDGITSERLSRILAHHEDKVLLIATMRSHEYDHYSEHSEASIDSSGYDAWRDARDVVRRAKKIRVPRRWSNDELNRAALHKSDNRINRALKAADRFGVAEVLASGPELVEAWQNAWAPGVHPRGAAIVLAAVDIRRSGVHGPIPCRLLEELHGPYLETRGGNLLRPESFQEGLSWALRPFSHSGASMLLEEPAEEYRAFDYLLETLNRDLVPDHTWDTVLAHVTPRDAFDMGITSLLDSRHDRAERAFNIAAEAGISAADVAKAVVMGKNGRIDQAVRILGATWNTRAISLGQIAPDTLDAHAQLAYWTLKQGNPNEALSLLTDLLPLRESLLGRDHPDTLDTHLRIANAIAHSGRPREALEKCRRLLPRYKSALGPDHIETLDIEARIATWTGKTGDYVEGLRLAELLVTRRIEVLGADHADTLYVRGRVITWLAALGQYSKAHELALKLLADRQRTLGNDHLHTLHTRRQLARLAVSVTGEQAARQDYQRTMAEHERVLGREHLLTQKVAARMRTLPG